MSAKTAPKSISTIIWVNMFHYIDREVLERLLTGEEILAVPEQRVYGMNENYKCEFTSH